MSPLVLPSRGGGVFLMAQHKIGKFIWELQDYESLRSGRRVSDRRKEFFSS